MLCFAGPAPWSMAKAKACRLRLLSSDQPEARIQERGLENSTLEDRGSMQGPTLRKAAHLQLSTAASGGEIGPSCNAFSNGIGALI